MKRLTIMVCALIGLSAYAHAAPALKLENIKQIVCESTVSYEEDSPNEKTAAHGVKIFKPGSRKDVKPRPGAFLLAEVDPDSDEQDADDQQFYFSPIKHDKLSFRFIAEWKAHGELNLRVDGTATGFINQKGISPSCAAKSSANSTRRGCSHSAVLAGRRRTACTRQASCLISCGDISVRIGIRFGTNTKCQCTPSISDDWGEADPERALSNRMTRIAQLELSIISSSVPTAKPTQRQRATSSGAYQIQLLRP